MAGLVASLVAGPATAAHDAAPPALSEPGPQAAPTTVPMPDDWVRRPVVHAPTVSGEVADLAITLDQQLYPALLPIIRRYGAEHNLAIAVQSGTCGVSAGALVEKQADIGGFCCPPGPMDRLPGLTYHTIGIGALAFITHPANGMTAVSAKDARGLFAGDQRTWSSLGTAGPATPQGAVEPIIRLHCKNRPGHWRLIHDTADDFSIDASEVSTIEDMLGQVSQRPAAIGYETLWHVRRTMNKTPVRTLRIDGVAPDDRAAVAAGRYPFYRVFNITTWAAAPAAKPAATALAAHLVATAQNLDAGYGIIPAEALRHAGWRFDGAEVVAPPPGQADR